MYTLCIRSIIDTCAPAYYPVLNGSQSDHLEKIQSKALNIIRGKEAQSYRANREMLDIELLSDRRELLTKHLALKILISERQSYWFVRSDIPTRPIRSLPT